VNHLVHAPAGQVDEAPASWLTRIALSQGITISDLLSTLPSSGGDVDVAIQKPEFRVGLSKLGLNVDALHAANAVFSNFRIGGLGPSRFLLFDGRRPRYRFCPGCFSSMRQPYIPVHWRFTAWHYCPLHACAMVDACTNCGSKIVLPKSMTTAGPKGRGVAYLSYCLTCGYELSKVPTMAYSPKLVSASESWLDTRLANGRAVLAALYKGHVWLSAEGKALPVRKLIELERRGMLPGKVLSFEDLGGQP
jgi:hypothetical protein